MTVSTRRIVLLAIAGSVLLCTHLFSSYLLPAYDELALLMSLSDGREAEYARLSGNLAISGEVRQRFEVLAGRARQLDNDELTLSRFLLALEAAARHPSMTIVNIKPLPVADERTHRVYRVKMSVAGELQDVMRFVSDVTKGDSIVGIESFALRGVQGVSMVEFTTALRMIRVPSSPAGNTPSIVAGLRRSS